LSALESTHTQLYVESLITFGLLSALFIVGYNYFTVLFNYQTKIVESKNLLKNKNVELSNYIDSNLQLENFAHLASHELKTPLRNILNFSKLLNKKLGDNISGQEREMLSIIENQASEMEELIKDLFELS
jgi:signal transduction histidine kinase